MKKLLIANRGEVAVRIMRTCHAMGIESVAVYSQADRHALHVRLAKEAYCLGPADPESSYLSIESTLAAARAARADAIHPGYGFLSENPAFAQAVQSAGLIWVGPGPESMRAMSSKITAREVALANDVPVIAGLALAADQSVDPERIQAEVGLPLLIKASAGGGGIGMRELHSADRLAAAIESARAHALRQFGSGDLLLERLVLNGRHVEVQVLGDQQGNLVHLYERDCSAQRRRQKLIEEAPAPGLPQRLRDDLYAAALRLAGAVDYRGAGTVEFLVEDGCFYFLEMNTRLQVEHAVTEAICGLDLVELQLKIAMGRPLPFDQGAIRQQGHAIEARVYAEDPHREFQPAAGRLLAFALAQGLDRRLDSGVDQGSMVGHHYDGLLCKLIVRGEDRTGASQQLSRALLDLRVAGVRTNQHFLRALLESAEWEQILGTASVESGLATYLSAASPRGRELDLALAAATIWQFRSWPPAADSCPWPGGYTLPRTAGWRSGDSQWALDWRWSSASCFEFASLGLRAVLLRSEDGEPWEFEFDGERRRFHFTGDSATTWLWGPALGNLELSVVDGNAARNGHENTDSCTSHGPGMVLKILVSEGNAVDAGDGLIVIESMKMERTLTATGPGRVGRIPVSEGELVASGQLLVQLDPDEERTA